MSNRILFLPDTRIKILPKITCILMVLFSLPSFNLSAQELKLGFTLDTAKTQVFPFDLDFKLKLVSPKDKPYKAVYLYRLNKRGDIIIDNNTSLKNFANTPFYDLNAIEKKILIDSIEAKNYLLNNKVAKSEWDLKLEQLNKKEIELKASNDVTAIKELGSLLKQIQTLKFKINYYNASDSLINYRLANRKKLMKQFKKAPAIFPLRVVSRLADTLVVHIEPLKPNKRYLIAALDYSDNIKVLTNLVNEYEEFGEFREYYTTLIPSNYKPAREGVFFTEQIAPSLLKKIVKKYKKVLEEYNKKPDLSDFVSKTDFPGSYSYPTELIQNRLSIDSSYTLPKDASSDFRELNGILVIMKKYGNDLVTGRIKIELDKNSRLDLNFQNTTKLAEQTVNITHNIKLVNKAKQSLYLLEQSDSIMEIYESYLNDFVNVLHKNKQSIVKKIQENQKVQTQLAQEFRPLGVGNKFITLEKTTHSYQFLTRTSRLIKPDFGLLYYSSDEGFQGVAPFAGFHFGIRSRNEDIPFNRIPGWQKYLSFQVGVPFFTESLIEEGRRKHLVGDTFSLYGGVGINLNHAIRISYGGIFFRGIDGNSVGEGTFKIRTAQAVAVSINLKLQSLFEGLYGSINSLNTNK